MSKSKWWLRLVFLLFLLPPVAGCVNEHDIEYFSLLDSMTPSAFGRPELSLARNTEEYPVEYVLERESYVIKARVDTQSIAPSVVFSVESTTADTATLVGSHLRCFVEVSPVYDFEVRKGTAAEGSIRATWSPASVPPCVGEEPLDDTEMVISLTITLGNDPRKFTEAIQFRIRKNGTCIDFDSF